MCKSMDNIISVSFKKTQCEQQLLQDINDASGFIGKSTWVKIACMEKLERDCNGGSSGTQYINYTHKTNQQINNNTNINSNQNNKGNHQCISNNNSLLDVNLGF